MIFLFLTFFNNILILIRLPFYLHGIARLVAPIILARQVATVAPVHAARQGCHAGSRPGGAPAGRQRCAAMAKPVTPHALARQPLLRKANVLTRASPSPPTLPFLPPLLPRAPTAAAGRRLP